MKVKSFAFVFCAIALSQATRVVLAQTTLANALDATNLVWSTGATGGVGWSYHAGSGMANDTFDGVASAQSGAISDSSETWIQTTVTGPGKVSFWWQAYSEPNLDWLEFYIDADLLAQICGGGDSYSTWPSAWEYGSFDVPAGTHVLKWRYAKDFASTGGTGDYGRVDRVSYVTSPPPPLQAALNTCGVAWSSTGSLYTNGWFAQTNVVHDGKWAAQSGAVWNNQTNYLQATVRGVTNVSFWWKVSSQSNGDYLQFLTNGVLARQISGEVGWQSNYFKLPSNTNTLVWRYAKNSGIISGSDCGWIDQVTFNPTAKALPYVLQPPTRLPDGSIQFVVNGEAGCPCRIESSTNLLGGTNWVPLTSLTTTNTETTVTDPSAVDIPARFYRAVSP